MLIICYHPPLPLCFFLARRRNYGYYKTQTYERKSLNVIWKMLYLSTVLSVCSCFPPSCFLAAYCFYPIASRLINNFTLVYVILCNNDEWQLTSAVNLSSGWCDACWQTGSTAQSVKYKDEFYNQYQGGFLPLTSAGSRSVFAKLPGLQVLKTWHSRKTT